MTVQILNWILWIVYLVVATAMLAIVARIAYLHGFSDGEKEAELKRCRKELARACKEARE